MANVKITALTDIGANILYTSLIPMVNMAGTPTTQKGNIQILGNYILSSAGSANMVPAALSNLSYSVVNAAQPNITSVGTLTSLAVTGNISSNNYVTANFFVGDGGLLTNVSSAGTSIANGTSNVSIPAAGGNILFSRGGVANVLVVTGTGANVTGNFTTTHLNVTGNVTSNLLPNANVTYNLGSATQRWNDLWLSNSTIYIGNSTISAGSSNSVVFSGSVQADGNITTSNGNSVTITTSNVTSYAWTFDADGNFTLPGNTWAVNYANGTQVQIGGNTIGNFVVSGNMFMLNDPNVDMLIQQSANDITAIRLIPDVFGPDSGVHIETGNIAQKYIWHFEDDGNLTSPGNVFLEGAQIFAGQGASSLPLANATLVISSNSSAFIQAVINNVSDEGSADWVAQGHLGDDDGGWVDMGFNSINHTDPGYSLTGPGDGYLIIQGYYPGQVPGSSGGNLVIATGEEGTVRDIIFGTGGFETPNMFARMSDANNAFEFTRSGAAVSFPAGSEIGEVGALGEFGINSSSNNDMFIKTAYFDGTFTTEYTWTFDALGNMSVPGSITGNGNSLLDIVTLIDEAYLTSTSDDTTALWLTATEAQLYANSNVYISSATTNVSISANNTVSINSNTSGSNKTWMFSADGNLSVPGSIITSAGSGGNISGANVISANTFQSTVIAYSSLPAATTAGLRAFINDANLVAAGNFGATVNGGGSNTVSVYSDGINWKIG